MPPSLLLKILLCLGGLAGLFIGVSILLFPMPFYASTGIDLSRSVSMLSELRAIGATFVSCGVLVVIGAFRPKLTYFATLLAAMLYLSCAAGRLVSLGLDGMPSTPLLWVMSVEWLLGLFYAACIVHAQRVSAAWCSPRVAD